MEIKSHTGLRGIAATIVFVVHLFGNDISITHWFLSFYSVDLFFVLSGFILYWVYIANKNKINWKEYSIARAARILPLYYLTLIICIPVIYNQLPLQNTSQLLGDVLANLFVLSTILGKFTFNGPSWSISVEWFCYFILFPCLFYFRKYIPNNRFGIAMVVICILALTRMYIVSYRSGIFSSIGINLDNNFLERGVIGFTMGFLLCFIFTHVKYLKVSKYIFDGIFILLSSIILLSAMRILPPHFILYSIPFLVLITAFERGFAVKFFEFKIIQWLGTRSYSIYLWHWLIIEYTLSFKDNFGIWFYAFIVGIIVALVSELSYKYFEMPIRNNIRFFFTKKTSVA